jgi:hypothetical protein
MSGWLENWRSRKLWTLLEAAQIYANVEPLEGTTDPHAVLAAIHDPAMRECCADLYAAFKDGVDTESLPNLGTRTGTYGTFRARPIDFLCYVRDKKLPVSPAIVRGVAFSPAPQPRDDEYLATTFGWTINGAARQLHRQYGVNEDAIRDRIVEAVLAGRLAVRDPDTGLPYAPETLRTFLDRIIAADLNAFFKTSGVDYRLVEGEPATKAGVGVPSSLPSDSLDPENWKMRVQAEAAIRWRRQRKLECNPTKHALKDELAKWCREKGIKTTGGINPSAEYIYRHALSSWRPPADD